MNICVETLAGVVVLPALCRQGKYVDSPFIRVDIMSKLLCVDGSRFYHSIVMGVN